MDKNQIKLRSTEDITRISIRCIRIVIYFLVLFYVLMFFISQKIDRFQLTMTILLSVFVCAIPCVIIPLFKLYESTLARHIIIWITVIVSTILITEFNALVYPIIVFPILIASLYYNRTFVLYTALLVMSGLVVSSLYMYHYPDNIIIPTYTSDLDIMMHYTLPMMIIVVLMSFISFLIVSRNALLIDKYIDTAVIMTENEKSLIFAFSEISENKSKETGEHIKRVAEYMKILGHASGFDDDYCEKLATASMMHDIGKLMINEEILDKPGKLTDEEYQIMKSHVLYGEALLKDCPGEIMKLAATLAKEHHEKWDGTGYLGMKGEEISYIARLMTLCDVFDALTSDRSYKKGWSFEDTYDHIIKGSGKHFDPKVVRLFIKNFDKFKEVHERIPDTTIYHPSYKEEIKEN